MRNAWTDAYVDTRQSERLKTKEAHFDPLRTALFRALSKMPDQRMSFKELLGTLADISDDAIASAIHDGVVDGVIEISGDDVCLTTLGHRAALAIF